ncbi:MAG: homocysteine S-methyltransferase family protein [Victivallaceae bacterium]|nr:homocysteine S-methyltransferase family protein [Victivallaceae bacterium]
MNKKEFSQLCRSRFVILDGATGTELVKRGMPAGVSPELFAMEHPEIVDAIHNAYFSAGSDIVYVPSFGGNRPKLEEFGAGGRVREINSALAANCRRNAGSRLIFGDISPTGKFLKPWGDLDFEELVAVYAEQIAALADGGVDGFAVETMFDLQQARAALIAAKETAPDLPVIVTLTFDEHGRTLSGNDPKSALITLQSLGADAFGCNCSTGPEQMLKLISAIKPFAAVPLVAKPNAGMPKLAADGRTVFGMSPETFGGFSAAMRDAGVNVAGGCCGTTPEHIAALSAGLKKLTPRPTASDRRPGLVCSAVRCAELNGRDFMLIGERINPTGKKALQAELRAGKMDMVREFAAAQTERGAALLDVNMGLGGVDEKALMLEAVEQVSAVSPLPLAIDSTSPEVVAAALRRYPGRALLNSISAERERLEKLLPVAAFYGAAIIILPVADSGVPETAAERAGLVKQIFAAAQKYGYGKNDCVVDLLVMAVASGGPGAVAALETAEFARDFGMGSVCGLSNVSFGLPARPVLNATFMKLARERGLTGAIANPSADFSLFDPIAADALLGRDPGFVRYLERFSNAVPPPVASAASASAADPLEALFGMVLKGDEPKIAAAAEAALQSGVNAGTIMDRLIDAINVVGRKFSSGEYFLPQLLMSADAMRRAIAVIEPRLKERKGGNAGETVVMATVEGDIHDIGKNIVCLMLGNYGFKVIDLGKDVSAAGIVAELKRSGARLCGLSALMTTTMPRMKETIDLARAEGLDYVDFILGGAAVDAEFAAGAGGTYARDAMETVRFCQKKGTGTAGKSEPRR